MELNLPWWFMIFYVAYLVIFNFGIGAVIGAVAACIASNIWGRGRFNRVDGIGFLILGAALGGGANWLIVSTT